MLNAKLTICAALLLFLPIMANAKEAGPSPEHFMQEIYKHYTSGKTNLDPLGKDKNWMFGDQLLTLIELDQTHANARNEVPWLNGDPICDCQEYSTLKNVKIGKVEKGAGEYPIVPVSFTNGDKKENIKFILEQVDLGWKIHDIATEDEPSLLNYLAKGIEENKINGQK